MASPFIRRFVLTPPVIFPVAALFYAVMLCYYLVQTLSGPSSDALWASCLWLLILLGLMCGVCSLKKWTATTYVIIATASLYFNFGLPEEHILHQAANSVFPVEVIVSAMVLFFYKRFS